MRKFFIVLLVEARSTLIRMDEEDSQQSLKDKDMIDSGINIPGTCIRLDVNCSELIDYELSAPFKSMIFYRCKLISNC